MQTQLAQLIDKKLAEELRKIDSVTLEAVDTACNGIRPAPTCPHVSDVMEAINHACGRGHVERAKIAREVIVSTISPIKDILTPKAADQIMAVITKAFPEDWFLSVAQNIKDVYKGGSIPTNKFHERAFELALSSMRIGAINASRRGISSVRTALDEILLQRPPWWKRLRNGIWRFFALPLMKWVFGIAAIVIAAILLEILGLKGP
ncbi:MAG: hypothetical protein HYX62_02565 [Gammaproteobacteria bacterium]|nr:hypothetical protein [Gammaproteobacteria bacterium]